jgi:hypothetical protein
MVITEAPTDARLAAGSVVEVRRRFDGAWAGGFEVSKSDDGGYWLRRVSDGSVLPVEFAPDDVRPAPAAVR